MKKAETAVIPPVHARVCLLCCPCHPGDKSSLRPRHGDNLYLSFPGRGVRSRNSRGLAAPRRFVEFSVLFEASSSHLLAVEGTGTLFARGRCQVAEIIR